MRNSENCYSAEATLQDAVDASTQYVEGLTARTSSSKGHDFKEFQLKKLTNFNLFLK